MSKDKNKDKFEWTDELVMEFARMYTQGPYPFSGESTMRNKLKAFKEMNSKSDICSICYEQYVGFGNNAEPVTIGRCCDKCNTNVLMARIMQSIKTITTEYKVKHKK